MTALAYGHNAEPVKLPNKVAAIRDALPDDLRARFQDELDEAVDRAIPQGDVKLIDQVKGRWWAQALWNIDPSIGEAFDAIDRGDFEVVPDPFKESQPESGE